MDVVGLSKPLGLSKQTKLCQGFSNPRLPPSTWASLCTCCLLPRYYLQTSLQRHWRNKRSVLHHDSQSQSPCDCHNQQRKPKIITEQPCTQQITQNKLQRHKTAPKRPNKHEHQNIPTTGSSRNGLEKTLKNILFHPPCHGRHKTFYYILWSDISQEKKWNNCITWKSLLCPEQIHPWWPSGRMHELELLMALALGHQKGRLCWQRHKWAWLLSAH